MERSHSHFCCGRACRKTRVETWTRDRKTGAHPRACVGKIESAKERYLVRIWIKHFIVASPFGGSVGQYTPGNTAKSLWPPALRSPFCGIVVLVSMRVFDVLGTEEWQTQLFALSTRYCEPSHVAFILIIYLIQTYTVNKRRL